MSEAQDGIHFLDYWRVLRSRKEIVIAIALLVVLSGVLITLFALPKVYMASTLITVEESSPDVPIWQNPQYAMVQNYMFLNTQFEIIQSKKILYEVIRTLGLERRFGEAYGYAGKANSLQITMEILASRVKVRQYRDTNLIEIRTYLSKPEETAPQDAARIANTISEVFRIQREATKRKKLTTALDALYEEQLAQSRRVDELEQQLGELRVKYQIVDEGSSIARADTVKQLRVKMLVQQANEKLAQVQRKKVMLDTVEGLSDEELLNAQDFIVGNPSLGKLKQEKIAAEVKLQDMLKNLGARHPEVVSLRAGTHELDQSIARALDGLRTGIRLESASAVAELKALEDELAKASTAEIEARRTGYVQFSNVERELERQRRVAEVLKLRWLQERIELEIPRTTVEVIEEAEPPSETDPVSPILWVNLLVSVVLGVGCGVGVAFFMEYVDTSVKTVEDIEKFIGLSVLGIIPQKVQPLIEEGPESPHAEAYRVLRTNMLFSKKLNEGKTICVTSGSVGEGKSLTTANLAYVCAQLGERVLIVDSDLRRPRQHRILNVSNRIGLANVLMGDMEISEAIQSTPVERLDFLPSGKMPTASHGLLDTMRIREVISSVRSEYDYIFFDSPPIMGVSDASVLASEVDAALLVIQYHKYPRSVSARAKNLIENVGGNLLGVVLNNINISRDSYYYYYYHTYYSTYNKPDPEATPDDEGERSS